ncbi:MAG: iron chaperone [Betaproteobacteria bacterium]
MKPTRKRKTPRRKPATVEEYLARLSADKRAALQKLRKAIHAAAPGAEECISYQLPAVRLHGKVLVWFGAARNHCSFYPGGVVQDCLDDLEGYDTSKGTVRFTPDNPLPVALVRKLVRARIAKLRADHRV